MTRDELIEEIEVTIAEVKPIAQPRDLTQMHELLLDARDADKQEQLDAILVQLQSLRAFCEARKLSEEFVPSQRLPHGRVKP